MLGACVLALFLASIRNDKLKRTNSIFPFTLLQITNTAILSATNSIIFWTFLKIGAILYGSGYILFAFIDTEFVSTGMISRQQLIDTIAVRQFTPGPVFSSVTFIGYQINGLSGAILSTIAIFLPSFVFVAFLNPLVKKMKNSKLFSVFLDAVNRASVVIIISICLVISKDSITDWGTIFIAILSIAWTF